MKNFGCHCNQSKKPLKIFSQTNNWIAFLYFRNVPYIEVYRIPYDKNDLSKDMAFMGDSFSFHYNIGKINLQSFKTSPREITLLDWLDYLKVVSVTSLWYLV